MTFEQTRTSSDLSRMRRLLDGLLALGIAGATLVGAIAAYRFLVHRLLAAAFRLDDATSSIVRRIDGHPGGVDRERSPLRCGTLGQPRGGLAHAWRGGPRRCHVGPDIHLVAQSLGDLGSPLLLERDVSLSGESDVRAQAPLSSTFHGSALWTGGAFGPEDSLINIVVMIGICFGLWLTGRQRKMI